jgi:hypothetical protein
MPDLQGIAATILGPTEKARDDEPDEGDLDVGLITAAEEIMDAYQEGKATELARALKAFVEMCQ